MGESRFATAAAAMRHRRTRPWTDDEDWRDRGDRAWLEWMGHVRDP